MLTDQNLQPGQSRSEDFSGLRPPTLPALKDLVCYEFCRDHLRQALPVVLFIVADASSGSPGRQGFKLAIAKNGAMTGTIGGGVMEYKAIQEALRIMNDPERHPVVTKQLQIHRKDAPADRSGMICSGQQLNVSCLIDPSQAALFERVAQRYAPSSGFSLKLSPNELSLVTLPTGQPHRSYSENSPESWYYLERLAPEHVMHVVGAGHVGTALSRTMRDLGFYVKVYDHRPELHLLRENIWAHEKVIGPFEELGKLIPDGAENYVAVVSTSFKTDEIALRALLGKRLAYIGAMGSDAKLEQIKLGLTQSGTQPELLAELHAPIGIPIRSHSVEEIAISIAAEIIALKNGT